eukprot:97541-Rhodomonas_salina.1
MSAPRTPSGVSSTLLSQQSRTGLHSTPLPTFSAASALKQHRKPPTQGAEEARLHLSGFGKAQFPDFPIFLRPYVT